MIFVFKTNVETKEQVDGLKDTINKSFPDCEWNFDLEDRDRIFRIESNETDISHIVSVFKSNGFICDELSDQIIF